MTCNTSIGILLKQDSIEITELKRTTNKLYAAHFSQHNLLSPLTAKPNRNLLKKILRTHCSQKSLLNIGISTQFITLKTFNVDDALSNKEIKAVIQQQQKSIASSYLHYQCVPSAQTQKKIMLLAVNRDFINQAIRLICSNGIKPSMIEAEPFAALRLLPNDDKPHLMMIQRAKTWLLCLCQAGQLVHCKNVPCPASSESLIQEALLYKANNPALSTLWLHTTTQTQDVICKLFEKTTGIKPAPLNGILKTTDHIISTSLAERGFI